MSTPPVPPTNRLLALLPPEDLHQVMAHCEPVELTFEHVLYTPGELIRDIYFPTDSFVSLIASVDNHSSLEVGLVGNEGMIGLPLILGVNSTLLKGLVQGAGSALRMEAALFLHCMEQNSALRQGLNRYVCILFSQLAQTTVCIHYHRVEARLARWLLMTQDRAHSDTFRLTHEFLAYMLGVRRVGVTKAASSLQRQKLIHYSRGKITILDRDGLQIAACACYRTSQEIYRHLLG